MGNAGRVLMIPKGDYNAATTYEMLDCVYYNGRSYVCKQTSTGNAPTNTTYWQVMTPDSSAEIQALTNKLEDEAETRAALGAHNLLPIDLASLKSANSTGTWSGSAYTVNNTTLTLNDDKSISVTTGSGGASASFVFWLIITPTDNYSDSNYILSGCPEGGGNDKYTLRIYKSGNTYAEDTGSGANVTGATGLQLGILIVSGQSLSDKVFKPMIRLATDSDPTYQPYAMTNRELTDALSANNLTAYTNISGYSASNNKYTAPSDGYLYVKKNAGNTNAFIFAYIYGADGARSFGIRASKSEYDDANAIFVKKGMMIYITNYESGDEALFLPLG